MNVALVDANGVAPQAWRNGGGTTRELLTWPASGDWQLRISRADIAADGPFSAFPGVERWFTVLDGRGVVLTFGAAEKVLRVGDAPLQFDGAQAPGCRLLDGPTTDLNLMARRGRSWMGPVVPAVPWDNTLAMRGMYTSVAGAWSAGSDNIAIAAGTLLWVADPARGPWTFSPAAATLAGSAIWLAFEPTPEYTNP